MKIFGCGGMGVSRATSTLRRRRYKRQDIKLAEINMIPTSVGANQPSNVPVNSGESLIGLSGINRNK